MKFLVIQGTPPKNTSRYEYTDAKAIKSALMSFNIECDIWGPGYDSFSNPINFNSYDIIFLIENYWHAVGDRPWLPDLSNVHNFKILWAIDEHCLGVNFFENEFNRSKYSLYLTASLQNTKPDRYWFPCSFNDKLVYPMNDIPKSIKIGFCGNLHNRKPIIDFLHQMKYNVCVDNKYGLEMVQAINSYNIQLNRNISYDVNIRNFETIACKTLLLTNYNEAYSELGFIHGNNCLVYNDSKELTENINDILTDERKLVEISERGYELSKKHCFKERIKHLLKLLESKI